MTPDAANGHDPVESHALHWDLTTTHLRRRLVALWDALQARGATVHRIGIDELPLDVLEALSEHEAARLRALPERDMPPPPPTNPQPEAQRAALRALLALIARTVTNTHQRGLRTR